MTQVWDEFFFPWTLNHTHLSITARYETLTANHVKSGHMPARYGCPAPRGSFDLWQLLVFTTLVNMGEQKWQVNPHCCCNAAPHRRRRPGFLKTELEINEKPDSTSARVHVMYNNFSSFQFHNGLPNHYWWKYTMIWYSFGNIITSYPSHITYFYRPIKIMRNIQNNFVNI